MEIGINDVFSEEDLAYFSCILRQKRDETVMKARQVHQDMLAIKDIGSGSDDVDVANAVVEQNLNLRFLERYRSLLTQIDAAIARINEGSYGYCEGTGEPIPKKRLEARPWCRYNVQYKELLERHEKKMKVTGINSEIID